ncbi:mas-related G-protein coupled receptor member H-like [Pelodiscus sinensis]|uniref:mas-related G-protein coupled receptor member H-like n=1 Tax=Pelodiscus sinensis TaxID=13735 RepID=UPI003F6BF8CB
MSLSLSLSVCPALPLGFIVSLPLAVSPGCSPPLGFSPCFSLSPASPKPRGLAGPGPVAGEGLERAVITQRWRESVADFPVCSLPTGVCEREGQRETPASHSSGSMMAELSTETLPPTAFSLDSKASYNDTGCPGIRATKVTTLSITLIICLLGLVGNGIVIWFLGFRMKRNPFTVYVLNLAVADTVFLLCSVAHRAASMVFCENPKVLDIWFAVLYVWTYNTSLYFLTVISTERCVSVLCPIWYRCRRPRHLSAIVSALLWALPFLLFCCSIGVFCLLLNEFCANSLLYVFVLNVLIFSPIMVLSSLILSIKVRWSSQQRPPGKLYAVILLTVLFFLLLTLPHSFGFFLSYLHIIKPTPIFYMLACASSSINPFIYFLVGSYGKRRFRGSLKLSLRRVFEEQRDSGEDKDPRPSTDPIETVV